MGNLWVKTCAQPYFHPCIPISKNPPVMMHRQWMACLRSHEISNRFDTFTHPHTYIPAKSWCSLGKVTMWLRISSDVLPSSTPVINDLSVFFFISIHRGGCDIYDCRQCRQKPTTSPYPHTSALSSLTPNKVTLADFHTVCGVLRLQLRP